VAATVQNPSLTSQFEQEVQLRAIEGCSDLEELRDLARTLLKAWHMQSQMTRHYGAQAMGLERRSLQQ